MDDKKEFTLTLTEEESKMIWEGLLEMNKVYGDAYEEQCEIVREHQKNGKSYDIAASKAERMDIHRQASLSALRKIEHILTVFRQEARQNETL